MLRFGYYSKILGYLFLGFGYYSKILGYFCQDLGYFPDTFWIQVLGYKYSDTYSINEDPICAFALDCSLIINKNTDIITVFCFT